MIRETRMERKWEEGRGIIDLERPESYKPWIYNRELTSGSGKRHVLPDIHYPQRMIHLMSNLEKEVYFMLRRNEKVLELFEQVQISLTDTMKICEREHLLHPRKPYTNQPNVMTTDFVAYVDAGKKKEFRAYAVKMSEELEDERVLEKLRIEQLYWKGKGVLWEIITEKSLTGNKCDGG